MKAAQHVNHGAALRGIPNRRQRIGGAIIVGLAAAAACMAIRWAEGGGASDFRQALWLARDLLSGDDPYNYRFHAMYVPYPLPAAFFALPLLPLPLPIAASVFIGVSSGLLAYGLLEGGWARLALFLCAPYWNAVFLVQWSPLIAASAFFWWLAPVLLVKPQIALPVVLTHLNRRGVAAIIAVLLISLVVLPEWPLRWLAGIGEYQRVIPLLSLPGLLLPLALLRFRDRDSWMLLLAAIFPQRAMYDLVALWLIPRTLRSLLVTSLVSWIFVLARPPFAGTTAELLAWGAYVPMLAVILLRGRCGARAYTPCRAPAADVRNEC